MYQENKYSVAKRTGTAVRGTVYQAKCTAERKRFGKFMQQDDQKCDVLKVAKSMVKTNQDIICEQCIRNDDNILTVSDEDKEKA